MLIYDEDNLTIGMPNLIITIIENNTDYDIMIDGVDDKTVIRAGVRSSFTGITTKKITVTGDGENRRINVE